MATNAWLEQMFEAQAVQKEGGIVRRKKANVKKHSSLEELTEYVKELGFHLIETRDQYVVICNSGALRLHC
jgi:ATP-dependent RNA circularization protein (DNA/RNA ligase family)